MIAGYSIINADGTKNDVLGNYEISPDGSMEKFDGEVKFVPSDQRIKKINDGVFEAGEEIHCEYFSKSFCDRNENEIDYGEINSPFFALIRYASEKVSVAKVKIILKINGETDYWEFEDINDYVGYIAEGLLDVQEVFYNNGPREFGAGIIYDLPGVKSVYLPSTVKKITGNAFVQNSFVIPCLENINVLPCAEDEREDDYFYSIDGMLFYCNLSGDEDDCSCDELVKVPAGKREPNLVIPAPMNGDYTYIKEHALEDVFFVSTVTMNFPCKIHPYAFAKARNLKYIVFDGDGVKSHFAWMPYAYRKIHPVNYEIVAPVDAYDIIEYCVRWDVPISFTKRTET